MKEVTPAWSNLHWTAPHKSGRFCHHHQHHESPSPSLSSDVTNFVLIKLSITKVSVVDPPFIIHFTDFRLVLDGEKVKAVFFLEFDFKTHADFLSG